MSINELLEAADFREVVSHGGIALLAALTLVQISPIKINPWSWLWKQLGKLLSRWGKAIGKALNGEVMAELTDIKDRLTELEQHDQRQDKDRGEDKALDARRRILQFADEIRRKVRHSEEHFNNAFEDIDYYKTYCREHTDFENDKARISIKIIEETYDHCVRTDDFL